MSGKMIGRFGVIEELGRDAQGLVYLARDPRLDRDAKKLQITPKQLSMLRTLRNQAVLAIKQKT